MSQHEASAARLKGGREGLRCAWGAGGGGGAKALENAAELDMGVVQHWSFLGSLRWNLKIRWGVGPGVRLGDHAMQQTIMLRVGTASTPGLQQCNS